MVRVVHLTLAEPPADLSEAEPFMCGRCQTAYGDLVAAETCCDDYDELERDLLDWSHATFPRREPLPTAVHLRREAAEVCAALARGEGVGEEMADVFLLLLALADCAGVDLLVAARAKLAELKQRRWAPPDAEGVVEHVRE